AVELRAVVQLGVRLGAAAWVGPFLGAGGEPDEVGDGLRSVLLEQADSDVSLARLEDRVEVALALRDPGARIGHGRVLCFSFGLAGWLHRAGRGLLRLLRRLGGARGWVDADGRARCEHGQEDAHLSSHSLKKA